MEAVPYPQKLTVIETNLGDLPDLDGDRVPVLIGSGISPENAADYACADGFIVGSYFKEKGDWRNELCPLRIDEMCKAMQPLCDG